MLKIQIHKLFMTLAICALLCLFASFAHAHGTVVSPMSRAYRVYQANPDNPSFPLAASAVAIDGTLSYYTWNEVSRNIAAAVNAGLPPAYDYSPWCPDGQLASGGRVDPASTEYPRTYAGLDQVSAAWPTTAIQAGSTIEIDFLATAPHSPSVWDVWMTTPDWQPDTALNWAQMEFLVRPLVTEQAGHYYFDLDIPTNRNGHHVIWIAWQRDDPVGEVFFSTCDVFVSGGMPAGEDFRRGDCNNDANFDLSDAITLLAYIFPAGMPMPPILECEDACDCNDDSSLNIGDAICILNGLFAALPPVAPYPACGPDVQLDSFTACNSGSNCP